MSLKQGKYSLMAAKSDNSGKDTLYRTPISEVRPFQFDGRVADVFADMIQRSVPGYAETLSIIESVAREYAQNDSVLYDLGCSLGAATLALRRGVAGKSCRIVAVDNSAAMVERCRLVLERDAGTTPVSVIENDLQQVEPENASVTVMNYTLQFIPADQRQLLLNKIYKDLKPGGVLVLSEKIVAEDATTNRRLQQLHERFKKQNGYNELEIAQKRSALEKVLIPETAATHKQRLRTAGFASVTTCLQFLNFTTFLALKDSKAE